jgi:galactokinase
MAEQPAVARLCASEFEVHMGAQPQWVSWAPGRINLIGGHTDYNGGLALPAAINRWVSVALRPRADRKIRIRSLDLGGEVTGFIDGLPEPGSSWTHFVLGSLSIFGAQHALPCGFDAVFAGDVPDGAGLSSSAALTIAWMTVLRAWTGVSVDDLTLTRYAQRVEHEFLGVKCGLLDQIGSLMARPKQLMLVDFRDVSVEAVDIGLTDVRWVVLHSGVRRELAGSQYLDRVQQCQDGLHEVQSVHPEVHHMRDVQLSMVQGPSVGFRRLRHVITENARVLEAVAAVKSGDALHLGAVISSAHESLRDDYEVSCPQLDLLVQLAEAQPGCFGARMVGGGFGGCTLNLVRTDAASSFIDAVLLNYRSQVSDIPRAFTFNLVGGASVTR